MAPSNRRIICQGRGIEHAKYKNYDEHLLNYGHKGKDFNRQYQNIAFFSSTSSCLETIFYTILESDANAEDILNSVAARCKKYPNKSITIDDYADKGTGNPEINAPTMLFHLPSINSSRL